MNYHLSDLEELQLCACKDKLLTMFTHLSHHYVIPIPDLNSSISKVRNYIDTTGLYLTLNEQIGEQGVMLGLYDSTVLACFSTYFLTNDFKTYYIDVAMSGLVILDILKPMCEREFMKAGVSLQEIYQCMAKSYQVQKLYDYLKNDEIDTNTLLDLEEEYQRKYKKLLMVLHTL
jgi:hypothetical protein